MFDIPANSLIKKAAEELKKIETIKPPEWSKYCKTGVSRSRPPATKDWWYIRSASVLRKICVYGPIGVEKLRTKYGGNKSRGTKPPHFFKGSGNAIRKILQQLEKSGLIQQTQKRGHKGRILTPKGKSFLDKLVKK